MPKNPDRGKGPILIVEDDVVARDALVSILSQLGYSTIPVATVAEGLERLNGQAFAILDLELPDGLGTHVLSRIRNESRPIRVAVTTGTSDARLLDEARRLKADLILRKPINLSELLDWLEHAD